MVSLCLFLSLCKLNFHEIDALTHHGSFPPVVTPAVTPVVTPMVSLWLTLSLCKLNFHEIDTPTHHGSFPPVVTPAVTPECPRGDPHGVPVVHPFSL